MYSTFNTEIPKRLTEDDKKQLKWEQKVRVMRKIVHETFDDFYLSFVPDIIQYACAFMLIFSPIWCIIWMIFCMSDEENEEEKTKVNENDEKIESNKKEKKKNK